MGVRLGANMLCLSNNGVVTVSLLQRLHNVECFTLTHLEDLGMQKSRISATSFLAE